MVTGPFRCWCERGDSDRSDVLILEDLAVLAILDAAPATSCEVEQLHREDDRHSLLR